MKTVRKEKEMEKNIGIAIYWEKNGREISDYFFLWFEVSQMGRREFKLAVE